MVKVEDAPHISAVPKDASGDTLTNRLVNKQTLLTTKILARTISKTTIIKVNFQIFQELKYNFEYNIYLKFQYLCAIPTKKMVQY